MLPIYKQRLEEGARASRVGDIANGKVVVTLRHVTGMGNLFALRNRQDSFDLTVSLFQESGNDNRQCVGKGESSLRLNNEMSELERHGILS